jgi:WD40 repeat protein
MRRARTHRLLTVCFVACLTAAAPAQVNQSPERSARPGEERLNGHAVPIQYRESGRRVQLDPYGDPLPEGAIVRLGTARFGHPGATGHVLYSPDGKFLAAASWDMAVRVWEMSSGRECHRTFLGRKPAGAPALPPGKGLLPAMAFSPDGKTLAASGADHAVHLLDTATGNEIGRFEGQAGRIAGLAFAPDGKAVAGACADGSLRLWDLPGGAERCCLKGHDGPALCLAFAPDGRTLASGGADKSVRLWDVQTGKQTQFCEGHERWVRRVLFVLKGEQVASIDCEGSLRLWDSGNGQQRHSFSTTGLGYDLLPGPDTASIITVASIRIETWDVRTAKITTSIDLPHHVGYFCAALAPDGKTIAVGMHGAAVGVREYPGGKEFRRLFGDDPEVLAVAFAPDGKTVATGTKGNHAQLWDVATGKALGRLETHDDHVHGVAYSPDGRTLASLCASNIHLWDVATGKERHCLRGHQECVTSIAFAPDGKTLASASCDKTVRLWDVSTGQQTACYQGTQDSLHHVAYAPDGRSLATLSQCLHVWNLPVGKERAVPKQEGWCALWYGPDGRLLALREAYDGQTQTFSLTMWDVLLDCAVSKMVLPRFPNGRMTMALSPDGRTLATGRHYYSGQSPPPWPNDNPRAMSIHFWELATGTMRQCYHGHEGQLIHDLVYSPDGKKLASGSGDSTVLLWDVYRKPGAKLAVKRTDAKMEQLWNDLASPDAEMAFKSMRQLLATPDQTLALLQRDLQPVPKLLPGRLAKLISDLDADKYSTRQQAATELKKLGEVAELALCQALQNKPSLELRRRVEDLLKHLEKQRWPNISPQRLRALRSMELLEHLGTPEARTLLQQLADGEPQSPWTHHARAALARLGCPAPACP